VQNIVLDDSHGANGPGNTFFRNRAELYGIFMNNNPPSPGQLFIGNEVTSTLPFTGVYFLSGSNHFEYGNNIQGDILPLSTNQLAAQSLYLTEPPDYFEAVNLSLPAIGPPLPLNTGIIPSQARFLSGKMTECEMPETPSADEEILEVSDVEFFPNPTAGTVFFTSKSSYLESGQVSLRDLSGKKIFFGKISKKGSIELTTLAPGFYLMHIQSGETSEYAKILILK
jgi:hypothetical protein